MSPNEQPTKTIISRLVGADIRSLAALRIALALCVLFNIANRARFIKAFLTDAGLLPRAFAYSEFPPLPLHALFFIDGGPLLPAILLCIDAIFALALLVGYRTKLATVVVWFLTVSLQVRNPLINQGGDILLRVLLFWSMFMPLAQCWSIDSKRAGNVSGAPRTMANFGTLGFGLQIALLYVFAALLKYRAPEWAEGTAVYYALNIDQLVKPFGKTLLAYPAALAEITKLVVVGEGFCALGFYFPWKNWIFRSLTLLAIVAMHLSFFLCFELGPFPWINSSAMLFFIPSELWDRLGARVSHGVATTKEPTSREKRSALYLLGQGVAALYIVIIVQWNLYSLDSSKQPAALIDVLISLPRVDQEWAMFAPAPQKLDGWLVLEGLLADGKSVDLFPALPSLRSLHAASWQKPELISQSFPSERWRKYFMNLEFPENSAALAPLEDFLCAEWNGQHTAGEKLDVLTIHFMKEITPPPGGISEQEKTVLAKKIC